MTHPAILIVHQNRNDAPPAAINAKRGQLDADPAKPIVVLKGRGTAVDDKPTGSYH